MPAAPQTPTDPSGNPVTAPVDPAVSGTPVTTSGGNIHEFEGNMVNNPSLPPGTQLSATKIQENPNEIQQYTGLSGTSPQASFHAQTAQTAQEMNNPGASTYNATQAGANTPTMTGAEGGMDPNAIVQAQIGALSADTLAALDPNSISSAVDPKSLVQNQYKTILADAGPDGIPLFAKDAVRAAMAAMSARGLGNSTMAGEAMTSAILQAALPIAQQDAKVFETMNLKVFDAKQQATLVKAGYLANMDMKNLDNRQQAAVINAQSFMALDMKNLDNDQQAAVINTQARIQTLLSDQAADNAAKNFNAASTNDVNKFFSGLNADIKKFNATQQNAMSQFNASQETAVDQFNNTMKNQREQFNVTNKTTIDASNVQWRRNINTANTAAENATNQINATNLLNISNTALNNLWQESRDNASWAFQASENQRTRDHNLAMAALNNQSMMAQMSEQQKQAWNEALGRFAANLLSR